MSNEFGYREEIDRPRHYTRLRYGDLLFYFFEDVDLDEACSSEIKRMRYADAVINKKTQQIIKCRYPIDDIFELALLTYRERDPVLVRRPK